MITGHMISDSRLRRLLLIFAFFTLNFALMAPLGNKRECAVFSERTKNEKKEEKALPERVQNGRTMMENVMSAAEKDHKIFSMTFNSETIFDFNSLLR